jgi:hypothetical protein
MPLNVNVYSLYDAYLGSFGGLFLSQIASVLNINTNTLAGKSVEGEGRIFNVDDSSNQTLVSFYVLPSAGDANALYETLTRAIANTSSSLYSRGSILGTPIAGAPLISPSTQLPALEQVCSNGRTSINGNCNSSGDDDDSGLSTGAVIGIIIGSVVGGILIFALVIKCLHAHHRSHSVKASKESTIKNVISDATVVDEFPTHRTKNPSTPDQIELTNTRVVVPTNEEKEDNHDPVSTLQVHVHV